MLMTQPMARCVIFERQDHIKHESARFDSFQIADEPLVDWFQKCRTVQLPNRLFKVTRHQFVFSPDFEHYIGYNMITHQFNIKRTQDGEIIYQVPKKLYATHLQGATPNFNQLSQAASTMQLMDG